MRSRAGMALNIIGTLNLNCEERLEQQSCFKLDQQQTFWFKTKKTMVGLRYMGTRQLGPFYSKRLLLKIEGRVLKIASDVSRAIKITRFDGKNFPGERAVFLQPFKSSLGSYCNDMNGNSVKRKDFAVQREHPKNVAAFNGSGHIVLLIGKVLRPKQWVNVNYGWSKEHWMEEYENASNLW